MQKLIVSLNNAKKLAVFQYSDLRPGSLSGVFRLAGSAVVGSNCPTGSLPDPHLPSAGLSPAPPPLRHLGDSKAFFISIQLISASPRAVADVDLCL